MSSTLLKGLAMLEVVDFHGPVTMAELTRLLGWDKAGVSRTVRACERAGWLERSGAQITIGARAALLGRSHNAGEATRAADTLVHALSGVTGLVAQAYVLLGAEVMAVAGAAPPGLDVADLNRTRFPLWASAGSKMIAAQLRTADLDARLPESPYGDSRALLVAGVPALIVERIAAIPAVAAFQEPSAGPTTQVHDRAGLDAQLAAARADGYLVELRELAPSSACCAVAWERPGLVASLACIGTVDRVEHDVDRLLVALRAAAAPGATRESIVAAAAH